MLLLPVLFLSCSTAKNQSTSQPIDTSSVSDSANASDSATGDTAQTPDTSMAGDTGGDSQAATDAANAMVEAALALMASLDAEQLDTMQFDLMDAERQDWSNLPETVYRREGLSLRQMTEAQVTLAHALLQASLSAQGYQKATDIILIEDLLNQSGDANAYADLYFVGIFDEPSMDSPWGWQFDGHHLALNFTAVGNEVTFSPSLWGTYPSIWEGGTHDGLRPMEDEEVLAWSFVQSLTEEQLEVALVSEVDPGDLYAGPHQDNNLPEPDGLPIADLTSDQREAVIAMIETYVGNLTDAHAELRMAEIEETLDDAMIAWMGSIVEGDSMYYRIQGSRVLVEFDHTNGPDHFHAVYRDPANDYGQNWLQKHRSEFHGAHPIQH